MNDLAERLRKDAPKFGLEEFDPTYDLRHEAAAEIVRLSDAIWEYGQHRPVCGIGDGKECDCGFFDILKSLKDAR